MADTIDGLHEMKPAFFKRIHHSPLSMLPMMGMMSAIFVSSSRSIPPSATLAPDWLLHGAGYGVLTFLTWLAITGNAPGITLDAAPWVATVIAIVYGMADEWHQSFVPIRDASVLDVAADAAGAVITAWILIMIRRKRIRSQVNENEYSSD